MPIRERLRKAGEELHHIVAQGSNCIDAAEARKILAKFQIDVNNALNGVFIAEKLHHKIHTKKYFQAVKDRLSKAKTRAQAIKALQDIAEELQAGKFPH